MNKSLFVLKKLAFSSFIDTSQKKPSSGKNLDALDGVRGFAVLLVIISHTNGLNLQSTGRLGVWLFFVLSGFLLTTPFVNNPQKIKSGKEVGNYLFRRFLRICPLYYTTIFIVYIIASYHPDIFIKHMFFVRGEYHLWTMPQEMFFYVLLPIIIALSQLLFKNRATWVALFVVIVGIVLKQYLTEEIMTINSETGNYPFYIFVFFIGVAFSYLNSTVEFKKLGTGLDVFFLVFLVAVVITAKHIFKACFVEFSGYPPPNAWYYPLSWAVASGFVVMASLHSNLAGKVFRSFYLRTLGTLSFSMYLVHPYVRNAVVEMIDKSQYNIVFILTFVISYGISLFTYSLIERPFMQIKDPVGLLARHFKHNQKSINSELLDEQKTNP